MYLQACSYTPLRTPSSFPSLQVTTARCQECCKAELLSRRARCCIHKTTRCASVYLQACSCTPLRTPSSFSSLQVTTAHFQECCKAELPSRRARCCIHKTSRCTSVYLQACCHTSSSFPSVQVTTAHCQECCKAELPSRRARCCIHKTTRCAKQQGVLVCTFRPAPILLACRQLPFLHCRSQQLIVRSAARQDRPAGEQGAAFTKLSCWAVLSCSIPDTELL